MHHTVFANKGGKGAKKAKSDQSRRFLIVDDSADTDESMSMELSIIEKRHEATAETKSAKKASASDDEEVSAKSKSSKVEDVIVIGDSKISQDEEGVVDSKSSKEGKSLKPSTRSIDPLESQSYIEYTRVQVPASANTPLDESSGAMSSGFAAGSSAIAVLIAASAVAMS